MAIVALLAGALAGGPVCADELVLGSGFRFSGQVLPMSGLDARTIGQNNNTDVPAAPYWMCDDGVRRFFVLKRNVADIIEAPRSRGVLFELSHERRSGRNMPVTIGLFEKTEFDKFGRRLIELQTIDGKDPVHQAITEIRPEYLKVESTSHKWVMGLDVSAIPAERLREIIGQSIDPQRVDDRKAVVTFFIQIGRYLQAREEVEEIAAEFPEQAGWAEEMRVEVQHLNALNALQEVRRRLQAGQYGFAYEFAKVFPADRVSADVFREARDIVDEIDALRMRIDRAGMLLDMLQAQLEPETAQRLAPLRAAVLAEQHPDNLTRLEPFLRAEIDEGLTPAEKLALAYSGWVVGSENAVTVLDEAIRLWDVRFFVLEYLRSTGTAQEQQQLLAELLRTEGVSLPRVMQIVERLPPPLAPPPIPAGEQKTIEVLDVRDQVRQQYTVALPSEYSPHHEYPLLVVLHAGGMSPGQELALWAGSNEQAGPAQTRGYVTIAPHYAEEGDRTYDYDSEAHAAVLECVNDARRRFRIDSDRVYLAGHGMGGDACFDIGMSHPGIFAGIVPINGVIDRYSRRYQFNDPQGAWYIVAGELCGDQRGMALELNSVTLNQMMRAKQDVVYCEYKKRGFETYFEEFARIFDWMAVHRRPPEPAALGVQRGSNSGIRLMRPFDTRFHWLEINGLPANLSEPVVWDPPRPKVPQPLTIDASVSVSDSVNSFYVKHPGMHATLWLSPDLVNFDRRIKVSHKGSGNAFFDFVRPDIGVLLEDLRMRGDRERLYWAKIEL